MTKKKVTPCTILEPQLGFALMTSKFPVPMFVGAVLSFEAERRCMCYYKPDACLSRLKTSGERVVLHSSHTTDTAHTNH